MLARSPRPLRSQPAALASAYEALADAAAGGDQVPIAVAEAAAVAREAIEPWLQADRPMAEPLRLPDIDRMIPAVPAGAAPPASG